MPNTKRYAVTGGGGFLGKALCTKLRSLGHEVTSIARGEYPELRALGVTSLRVDISKDTGKIAEAFAGATCVFHTAAKVEMWGRYEDFFAVNVVGTRNVLDACREASVPNLVLTSSPSVIASGADLKGVDESIPYPPKYDAYYPQTKAIAEQEVLKAHCAVLKTISLRPHLIYGPGDTNLEQLVLKRARQGRLVRIGSGDNLADFSYIDDCVEAHLCAAHALETNEDAGGKAYFISQGVPVKLWEWIDAALVRNGLPKVKRSVPAGFAVTLGALMEWVARISPLPFEPPFTKFLAEEMATHHYFNISAARRELGYAPKKLDILNW